MSISYLEVYLYIMSLVVIPKKECVNHRYIILIDEPEKSFSGHKRTSQGARGGGRQPPRKFFFGQNCQNLCNK